MEWRHIVAMVIVVYWYCRWSESKWFITDNILQQGNGHWGLRWPAPWSAYLLSFSTDVS